MDHLATIDPSWARLIDRAIGTLRCRRPGDPHGTRVHSRGLHGALGSMTCIRSGPSGDRSRTATDPHHGGGSCSAAHSPQRPRQCSSAITPGRRPSPRARHDKARTTTGHIHGPGRRPWRRRDRHGGARLGPGPAAPSSGRWTGSTTATSPSAWRVGRARIPTDCVGSAWTRDAVFPDGAGTRTHALPTVSAKAFAADMASARA